ncbi:MAG: hypothetical protein KAG84_05965 [Bacteroidales bacterium]|nr:hypothetical protein [Bacteroidales bacterium]
MNKLFVKIFFLLFTVVLLATSCKNDVDINDEYREISVVYGLLDMSETQHFIKITKAFQTDGNVYIAATDINNSQYKPEDIEMFIEVYNDNGTFIKDILLDTIMVTNKDSGAFYYPNHIVYATNDNEKLSFDNEYKLKIKNLVTGNLIESNTKLVQNFSIVNPRSLVKFLDFNSNYPTSVEWHSAVNGKLYQLTIRYFYTDIPSSGPTVSHYIDWVMPARKSEKTDGKETLQLEYAGNSFFDLIAAKVPLPESGMKRYSDSLQYIFTVAHENFSIYLDVNEPSSSIVQERPAFSNIGNGVGLFSSRFNKIRPFIGLSPRSLDSLYNGSRTYMLGFEDRPLNP